MQRFGCNYNKDKYGLVSNNKYFSRAAIMEDGRSMTDWRSSGYVNNVLRMKYGLYSDNDYRMFLQHNAVELMNDNTSYYHNMDCQNWVVVPLNTKCYYNKAYSQCFQSNPAGVGVQNIGQF